MRPDTPDQIGRRIRAIRKVFAGRIRTQVLMGRLLGVGKSAISNWENGRNEPDRTHLLPLLDPPYNLNLDYILMGRCNHLPHDTAIALKDAEDEAAAELAIESRKAKRRSKDTSKRKATARKSRSDK